MFKLPTVMSTVLRAVRGQIPYGEVSEEVRDLQKAIVALGGNPGPIDGIFGLLTEGGLEELFPGIVAPEIPDLDSSEITDPRIVRYDQPGGLDLRSTRHGGPVPPRSNGRDRYLADRGVDPTMLVIHWTAGPVTASKLRDMFGSGSDRAVSSHYGIDLTGTYQYLPDKAWAYHAGWPNQMSIGIDICQPVVHSRLDEAKAAGYDTRLVPNPPPKRGGYTNVLSLDPRIAKKTRDLVYFLCNKHNIPLAVPRNSDGTVDHGVVFESKDDLNGFSGVVGHHHCSGSKWDIAPWWQTIFAGTPLGD